MDPRFRFDDRTEELETMAEDILGRVRTAMPVRVTRNDDGHTIGLQPLVQVVTGSPDGKLSVESMAPLSDVPIQHAGGGGIAATFPHADGDEGVFLNASRNIDTWHQQGGAQPQADARQHSLSDGFFIPGIRSTPRKLKGVSKNSAQTRTEDKKSVHDVSHTAVTAVRDGAAHQINGKAVQTQIGGSSQVVDDVTIQHIAGKFLVNC